MTGPNPASKPDFSRLKDVMRQAGRVVVADIVQGIVERVQPSGQPQKQNAPVTIKRKGHDHPLIGGSSASPLLAREQSYKVESVDDETVQITIKNYRAKVGARVQKMGYEFFAISRRASDKAISLVNRYVTGQVRKWWKGVIK